MFNKLSIVAVLLFVPSLVFAKIGTRNLEEEIKHREFCTEFPLAASSTAATGLNGVIWTNTASSAGDASPDFTATGTIGTFLHPAKVVVDLIDGNTNDTLACASVLIRGEDQFGKAVSETISTLTETEQTSSTVFSSISYMLFDECTGASETTDAIQVKLSQEIGLGVRIARAADIESACIVDSSDSNNVKCAAQNDTTSTDIESAVDLSDHSLDISTAMFRGSSKVAHADGDLVCVRVRSSWSAN